MINIIDLGKISFNSAFLKQIQIHKQIQEGKSTHTLILCEHPHTITLSRQARISNILDYNFIKENHIDFVVGLNRGGDITYHGPGQLIGYLLFDLRDFGRNLGGFLNRIEDTIINTLAQFEIRADTKKGFRGAWFGEKKIASVGIGVNKWITLHGFALNVNTDLSFFDIIRPCGLNIKMTSMEKCLTRKIDMSLVKKELIRQAQSVFQVDIEKMMGVLL